jgi:DNA polymerase elongation subunit (family B)
MYDNYRLLSFNPYDGEKALRDNEYPTAQKSGAKEFLVQMFGINETGETAAIYVEGFDPFFYIKVGDDWGEAQKLGFTLQLKKDMGQYHEEAVSETKLIKRKKLYGFDDNKMHTFMLIKFKNETAMKKAKGLWYLSNGSGTEYKRTLNPLGYDFEGTGTILYEAQIPPLLRLFHIRNVSPSGWVALPKNKTLKHKNHSTSCDVEYTINYKNIIPLPKKETIVPYKICSFDIEASSSHGDFPLPVKNYKKLATNIADLFCEADPQQKNSQYIKSIIQSAFGLQNASEAGVGTNAIEGVDLVYPKKPVNSEMIDALFAKWITICPATYKGGIEITTLDEDNDIDYNDDDNEIGDDEMDDDANETGLDSETGAEEEPVMHTWTPMKKKPKAYKKKGTIIDLLNDKDAERDTKIVELTKTLTNTFPELKGDMVTFIGSTFLKYGQERPYLNHCIALGTCNQIDNAVIESYNTEKEVLLAWTNLIQKEDPDVIIGYNIFGFDYQFMYLRAKELGCERPFLQLSRNNREVCLNKNWRTGKEGLEENTLVIASGQHDLKFVKMTGRLQIDLYNYLRRDYQLSQYKLDYVSGYFIGDAVKKIEHHTSEIAEINIHCTKVHCTKVFSKNLTGLENGNFINFEEEAHSVDAYKNGKKFEVSQVDYKEGSFIIQGLESPDMTKKVRWGLAKDDVTPQDIFRMTNEGPAERAIIAKYCIQDCNLVHHLMRKIDVMTGYIEMASLCSVPLDFLVMRGQSIKLTSYIAKKCREKGILMPVLDKGDMDEGYEGAVVLEPKCNLYLDDPVACLDYGSLYPSSMISENISHDSKVLTKEYDLNGKLLYETGDKSPDGSYTYDNLPGYGYVDIEYNTYKWQRKNGNPKAGMEKIKVGYKQCRFAQYPGEDKAIMPAILQELLAARKATRKLIEKESDDFMKNILDKRQLSIKVTANSLYGQTGAKTSSFYEKDCAASTTAIGRKMLTYAKRVIEEAYVNQIVPTSEYGLVKTNAEYVYGDTDSVFFKFNLRDLNDVPIIGQKALSITIELAQQAGELATKFLKGPHDLEYEKTFLPFCLLSKKRYVGMLYETDPNKGKRKSMGIVLKRRDNAPIVKDIYGGIIDILMKEKNVERAVEFLKGCLQNMAEEKCTMDKLIITKSLRSGYKNPNQIAHKVLADRIGKRDSGNKPSVGDRIAFVFIENPDKKALQGQRIETPAFIKENNIKINYSFYITNQIMKPLQQVFALVLEQMNDFKKKKGHTLRTWKKDLEVLYNTYPDLDQRKKKEDALRNKEVKALLFDSYLRKFDNLKKGNRAINSFFSA